MVIPLYDLKLQNVDIVDILDFGNNLSPNSADAVNDFLPLRRTWISVLYCIMPQHSLIPFTRASADRVSKLLK